MRYAFREVLPDGSLSEQETEFGLSARTVPGVGSKLVRGGKTYRRVAAFPAGGARVQEDIGFVSRRAYRGWTAHKEAGGRFDAQNRPIFDSWKQLRETGARAKSSDGGHMAYEGVDKLADVEVMKRAARG